MPLSQANIISDIMGGSSDVETYNQNSVSTYTKLDRIFLVNGLRQNSTPPQAKNDAKALIQKLYPINSVSPNNKTAKARSYTTAATNSDDVVQVTLSYLYTDIAISATQWVIEVSNFLEMVDADTEYAVDDSNYTFIDTPTNTSTGVTSGSLTAPGPGQIIQQGNQRPIAVTYYPWWNYNDVVNPHIGAWTEEVQSLSKNGNSLTYTNTVIRHVPGVSFAHCGVFRPRKRIVFTRTVYGASDAQKIEAADGIFCGQLNQKIFRGNAPGTVLCMSCGVIYSPFSGSNLARLEFIARPAIEGWQPWVRYSNPLVGGTPANVFRFTKNGATGNGIRRSYQYTSQDFNQLLELFPGGVQGDAI